MFFFSRKSHDYMFLLVLALLFSQYPDFFHFHKSYINNTKNCFDWLNSGFGLVFSDNKASKSTQRSLSDFMKTGKVITRENPFWNNPIRFTEQIIWPSPVVHILTCRYEYPEMEYTSQILLKNRTVNIGILSFTVSCFHFKSNILMGKLTEIMPGI